MIQTGIVIVEASLQTQMYQLSSTEHIQQGVTYLNDHGGFSSVPQCRIVTSVSGSDVLVYNTFDFVRITQEALVRGSCHKLRIRRFVVLNQKARCDVCFSGKAVV